MANGWSTQKFRVVGSGYTVFSYTGKQLNFCDQIADQPPAGVAQPEPVQPLDERHPIEIAFPRAATAGSLTVSIREQWDSEIWRQFPGYKTGVINDIVDLYERSVENGKVFCAKLIIPPPGHKARAVLYHGCVIVDADLGEQVNIAAMTVAKTVTIMYTHTTRRGG